MMCEVHCEVSVCERASASLVSWAL